MLAVSEGSERLLKGCRRGGRRLPAGPVRGPSVPFCGRYDAIDDRPIRSNNYDLPGSRLTLQEKEGEAREVQV